MLMAMLCKSIGSCKQRQDYTDILIHRYYFNMIGVVHLRNPNGQSSSKLQKTRYKDHSPDEAQLTLKLYLTAVARLSCMSCDH